MKNSKIVLMLIFLSGILAMSSTGCYYLDGVDGNGNVKKENREISSFSGLEVGGAFDVFLKQGNKEELVIEADENLMEYIKTSVRGKTLVIETKENISHAKKLNLFITFKELSSLDLSGAVNVTSENDFQLGDLDIDCSGATEMEMNFTADEVRADFSGASEITLSGKANSCRFDLSGASDMDAESFEVRNFEIQVSGAGEAKIFVTENLDADVSGAGSIRYKGDPKINSQVSGAGSVDKR